MGILANSALDEISLVKFPKPYDDYYDIPVIDLGQSNAAEALVRACEEFGFFKVINHGVPLDLIQRLEAEAMNFFSLPDIEKNMPRAPSPFYYGSKKIGSNGDKGWLEYFLFHFSSSNPISFLNDPSAITLRSCLEEYITAIRRLGCELLERITDGLKIEERDVISRMVTEEKNDGIFRLNHYPPCPDLHGNNCSITGFGEHTDPQILSVLRSNSCSGLQICLKDGTWVPVRPDDKSFYVNVGDSLQVLTNGRFRSVRHRVLLANLLRSRLSMIYFFGPSPTTKIAPLSQLMKNGEQSLYKEFKWSEYKQALVNSRLSDHRLAPFEM